MTINDILKRTQDGEIVILEKEPEYDTQGINGLAPKVYIYKHREEFAGLTIEEDGDNMFIYNEYIRKHKEQ